MKHLFLLCGPKSGSTMVGHHISQCKLVKSLSQNEGQKLFKDYGPVGFLRGGFLRDVGYFANSENYNWDKIQEIWYSDWQPEDNSVCFQKSPPDLTRVEMLEKHFPNTYYLALVREPYAHIKSLAHFYRGANEPIANYAQDWITIQQLINKAYDIIPRSRLNVVSYEAWTQIPDWIYTYITNWIPELSDLNMRSEFRGPIECTNNQRYKQLSPQEREDIYRVLSQYPDIIENCGYDISPTGPEA